MIAFTTIFWVFISLIFGFIALIIYSTIRLKLTFRSKNVLYLAKAPFFTVYYLYIKKKARFELGQMNYDQMKAAKVPVAADTDMGSINYTVTDLEILKHIFVKDFDHFVNRRAFKMPDNDILIKKMLVFLKDEEWKGLRSKLSPTFTTGKIKRLFPLFNESAKKLVKYVDQMMMESSHGEIDLGDGYSKFTMDTIASAVCGMNSQAFDQKEPSIFEQVGKSIQITFNMKTLVRFLILFGFPRLAGKLGITIFGSVLHQFFDGAVKSSIKERTTTGQKGNDFIQLMLEARENKLKTEEEELSNFEKDAIITGEVKGQISEMLDDNGIVSNCVLFILAGFDTTQSLLLFCAYALAIHPEIQDKLRQEVDTVLEENDGDFTYDSIHRMAYLDMVINETLRFYPPAPITDRNCTRDYVFPGTDITVKKGEAVTIHIYGIHHDEEYYPEPEKFDPERFSPENRGKINTYAFLPFGQGPRNCIGMRFALTEVKLAIAQLVHNFDIEPSRKTTIPMEYHDAGSLKPKNGMWLSLKRRPGTTSD
ncbi:cytochrome P450 9e2 [Folsomia candida]|uniref:cytochrome P450 9e2 n=1 Tax=Folsomia candida TaxID=158441 RepID=UPI000B8F162A|nr:cytochrome P450 9e2 [Folsomia candida]XP_021952886.1 cytochrome P450 9e2 [Folsomia candida]